jgi:modification methylase
VKLAQNRIDAIQVDLFANEIFAFTSKRDRPRLAFGVLLELGLLLPGQSLYFDCKRDVSATVLANGTIEWKGMTGSIHEVGRAIRHAPCNGWAHWYYEDRATGELRVIDVLREQALALREAKPVEESQPVG